MTYFWMGFYFALGGMAAFAAVSFLCFIVFTLLVLASK